MQSIQKVIKIKTYIAALALGLFAFLSIFGPYISRNNKIDIDAVSCFGQNIPSCGTATEHITHWQGLFTTTIITEQILILGTILFVSAISLNGVLLSIHLYKSYTKNHLGILHDYFVKHFPNLQPLS